MKPTEQRRTRTLQTIIATLLASASFTAALPATASAYATIAPPPTYSTAPGLPDGRVYEQVSPTDKDGNEAGTGTNKTLAYALSRYSLAAADGNSVLFEGSGAFGETAAGYNLYFVSERTAAGWKTRSTLPRAQKPTTGGTITIQPDRVDPSADLSHVIFKSSSGLFAPPPYPACGYEHEGSEQLYLSGSDPFVAATWLERPEISNAIENCAGGFGSESGASIGGTPDFSTVYFTFPGTLLPEDASRAPHVHGEGERDESNIEAWGLYEDREGTLREAGVLPDGSLDPFGAVPAAALQGRALTGNQVSENGTRLFFVSPDPDSCGRGNNCETDPPELYVRENGERTMLVSRDTLLPQLGGMAAPAPAGVSEMPNPTGAASNAGEPAGSDVFASPDGSQAFFQSDDDLTTAAEVASPGSEPKMYDFDVETGSVTYLPGVSGQIVASSRDGSSFAFVDSSASPAELERWSEGPNGGTVTPVTQLPGGVAPARMSSDGSTVVFQTSAVIAGFNNGGNNDEYGPNGPAGTEQIYRYDAPTNTLSCVSCPPRGDIPTSDAQLSPLHAGEVHESGLASKAGMVEEHGVSADGSRIFFDTADPLVPQDSNAGYRTELVDGGYTTEQLGRDVYEWENGTIYLISSGKSPRNSYFLDSGESGSDVFFATADGLAAGDTDGAYDVYDARIPHPGDNPPPAAVPCEGSVCQGPPRVPAPLGAPASATFAGLGNVAPATTVTTTSKPKAKSLTNAQKLSAAIKACDKQAKKKRARCKAQARKKYAPKVKKSTRRDK